MRTTFFTFEIVGPSVPFSAVAKAEPGTPEWAALARLYDKTGQMGCKHRAGAWSADSLRRLAQRGGVVLRSAHTMARDSKGFFDRREVAL